MGALTPDLRYRLALRALAMCVHPTFFDLATPVKASCQQARLAMEHSIIAIIQEGSMDSPTAADDLKEARSAIVNYERDIVSTDRLSRIVNTLDEAPLHSAAISRQTTRPCARSRATEWAKKVSSCIAGCNFVNYGPI